MIPNWAKADPEFGFDFNIPSALSGISDGQAYISGTFTAAKDASRYEFAVPFFINEHTNDPEERFVVDVRRVDLQLRSFRNVRRTGSYFGVTLRSSYVSGINLELNDSDRRTSYNRFGLGVVFGYRREVFGRFFWGANVNVGKFLSNGDDLAASEYGAGFIGPNDNGSAGFFNIEFLKVGIRF